MSPTVRAVRLVVATSALQSLGVAATAVAVREAAGAARSWSGSAPADPARVAVALQAAAWTGLGLCALWFSAAVLACARDLARHPRTPVPVAARDCLRPAFVRSLLVVLVGGCLATPTPVPVADQDPGWGLLDGLPLPGLPTGHAPRPATTPAAPVVRPRFVRVRPGDCLWSITATLLGPGATDAAVARTWPRLHHANRGVVGPDPDLVRPGTRLRVPALILSDHARPAGAPR